METSSTRGLDAGRSLQGFALLALSTSLLACDLEGRIGEGTAGDVVLWSDTEPAADQGGGMTTQMVYVNFDGPQIDDCVYCSDATTDRSFAIGAHFGASTIDFAPYTNSSGQATIVSRLRSAFADYNVAIVTERPATGDYTMLVVSPTEGAHHGVAPLDCDNSNPRDIAFVYSIGDNSVDFMARASAHELGHSFGLSHVTSSSDFMQWASSGSDFTVATYDQNHPSGKCFSGSIQDAPAMLAAGLGLSGNWDDVIRLAGANRYATSARISAHAFAAPVARVYVATGENYPDGLAGGAAAGALDAPLLLVQKNDVPPAIENELQRLQPGEIVILGGTAVVSNAVAAELSSYTQGQVRRLSGSNRYATAVAISQDTYPSGTAEVFVATGNNFPDALAGGPPAAQRDAPLLLVTDPIPSSVEAELSRLAPERIVIMGGEAAVPSAVKAALEAHATDLVTRLAGADRYHTAVLASALEFSPGVEEVYVATGADFVDAIAASAAAAHRDSPLLLVPDWGVPASVAQEIQRLAPTKLVIVGGTSAVPQSVAQELANLL